MTQAVVDNSKQSDTANASQTCVAIAMVNYGTPDMIIDCIKTLQVEHEQLPNLHLYIIDNNSPDDSVPKLTQAIEELQCADWITLIPMPENGGFSYGNNAAIRAAFKQQIKPQYIYLLNPDTLIHPNAVLNLINYMDEHPEVGITGGAMVGPDNKPQGAARRFPSVWSELDSGSRLGVITRLVKNKVVPLPLCDSPHACDWVSGASMMIRTDLINAIGLMDEGYFLYFEELDYCYRAKKAGYEIHYVPDSLITHLEGASTGVNQRKRRGEYWYTSRRRYFTKTIGIPGLIMADLFWGIGRLTFNVRRLLRLGSSLDSIKTDPTYFAYDLLFGDLKAVLTAKAWRERQQVGVEL